MRRSGILLAGVFLAAVLVGCSEEQESQEASNAGPTPVSPTPPPTPVSPTPPPAPGPEPGPSPDPAPQPVENGYDRVGGISFYGDGFQGARTSSGEPYDKAKFTAANKTLANGSVVRVTNPANEQSILVCINDNGPFVPGRILDLSGAAAKRVGLTGVANMRVVEVQEPVEGKICAGRFVTDTGKLPPSE